MRDKAPDPRRLDLTAFCRAQQELGGQVALSGLPRLAASVRSPQDGQPQPTLAWHAQGLFHQPVGRDAQVRLHLTAHGTVSLTCQRCLEAMAHGLEVDRLIRFVDDEALAERLDEESEDEDVLAMPTRLNLVELVEDELILALPLVPRHDRCPVPVEQHLVAEPPPELPESADRPHPFAALAGFKPKTPPA